MCKCLSDKILKQLNNQTIKQSLITQTIKQSDNQAISTCPPVAKGQKTAALGRPSGGKAVGGTGRLRAPDMWFRGCEGLSGHDVFHHLAQTGVGFRYLAAAVDGDEAAGDFVVVKHRAGFGLVFLQAVADDLLGVVAAV